MVQSSPAPAASFAERLRAGTGRRSFGIVLTLLVEVLLLLLLLSLNVTDQPGKDDGSLTVVNIEGIEPVQEAAVEPASPEQDTLTEERPEPVPEEPSPPRPAEPQAPPPIPVSVAPPQAAPPAPQPPRSPPRRAPGKAVYGPPDKGRPAALRDTERVGTAPNGEPLYAAAWYREPRDDELGPYLSTARGPGWGLIACKTAPNYRVEDCVGLAEYPEGSQIMRAVLAAAWEFKVRPPRIGGRPQVGSWVRIRIDYATRPR